MFKDRAVDRGVTRHMPTVTASIRIIMSGIIAACLAGVFVGFALVASLIGRV